MSEQDEEQMRMRGSGQCRSETAGQDNCRVEGVVVMFGDDEVELRAIESWKKCSASKQRRNQASPALKARKRRVCAA